MPFKLRSTELKFYLSGTKSKQPFITTARADFSKSI